MIDRVAKVDTLELISGIRISTTRFRLHFAMQVWNSMSFLIWLIPAVYWRSTWSQRDSSCAFFMIDCRFGRVDILHLDSFCGTGKYTAAESHHFTRYGMYGKDYASPKTVAQLVIVRFVAESPGRTAAQEKRGILQAREFRADKRQAAGADNRGF